MDFTTKLNQAWSQNNSLVCVGLDPDVSRLPEAVCDLEYPIFEFNKELIDATHDLVCAYKPQIAYYAAVNAEEELLMTIAHIAKQYPEIPVILDAKRGDIGSTAEMYALEAFRRYGADAVTVNPYMGGDTLEPFLCHKDKGVVILCRTSNPGASQLQGLMVEGMPLYQRVAQLAAREWNSNGNVMLVIGATAPEELGAVRAICPEIPFLVPGVGAQGGDVKAVLDNGLRSDGLGLVINSSRGIIYASKGDDFAQAARAATMALRDEINSFRNK
jgi:orotidine-5'-phosphate decarboxylase